MLSFGGWQFPDGEQHLIEHMGQRPHEVDGRLSYQYHKLLLALAHVRQRRTAVDVGAHVGLWARHLARLFDRVEAFEPMPAHRDCFVMNVPMQNVCLHCVALGSADAVIAQMTAYAGNSGHSHIAEHGEIEVAMRTLDSFRLDDVDFVKIDVEGYEREVLYGAVETLKRCKPTLIVEQKPHNGSRYGGGDQGALRFLEKLGARIIAQKAGDYVLTWNQ